jgi:hypothetical protein
MRDYDKEPLVVKSNLFPIILRTTFILFGCIFAIYIVFLSGIIDWNVEGKTFSEIFIEEANKNYRFMGIFTFMFIVIIDLVVKIIALCVKPRKIYFKNDVIVSDKYFNELLEIKLDELTQIKISPYPIIGTGSINTIKKYILMMPIILLMFIIPTLILYIFTTLLLLLRALSKKADFKLSFFLI